MNNIDEINIKITSSTSGQQGNIQEKEYTVGAPKPPDESLDASDSKEQLTGAPPPEDVLGLRTNDLESSSELLPPPPEISFSGSDSENMGSGEVDVSPPTLDIETNYHFTAGEDIAPPEVDKIVDKSKKPKGGTPSTKK